MKKNLLFILLLFLCFGLFACAKKASDVNGEERDATYSEVGGYTPAPGEYGYKESISGEHGGLTGTGYYDYEAGFPVSDATGAIPTPGEAEPGEAEPDVEPSMPTEEPVEPAEPEYPEAGQLTASAYFDNDHFGFWKGLLTSNQEEKDGLFKQYHDLKAFYALNRVKVTLEGIPYARVTIDGFSGVTNSNGEVYLFPKEFKETYTATIEIPTEDGLVTLTKEVTESELTLTKEELDLTMDKVNTIQLMFVIDTTGSMGDEIRYLKSEIADVINQVRAANEDTFITLGLVFYRDRGDDYVTRFYDFESNIDLQQPRLNKEYADGGGDFPEAVAEALNKALEAQWSEKATKILVHVADAPDHASNYTKWYDAVLNLAKKGIRVITVASSGIDKETEFYFRCEALLTNGCYGYLTNDSGIGFGHIEATTEEKMPVEYLNAMLVRLINGFHTGEFSEPVSWRGQE